MGDIVTVTRRDVGDGWWEGELDGVYGLFPEKYVKLVCLTTTTAARRDDASTDRQQRPQNAGQAVR